MSAAGAGVWLELHAVEIQGVSTGDVPSSNLWFPETVPFRMNTAATASTGLDWYAAAGYFASIGGGILLGCDIVASGAEPVQCWVQIEVPGGNQIYWDSQSTGEGLGVRFVYRGQVPFGPSGAPHIYTHSAANINWFATVWGLIVPWKMYGYPGTLP